MLSEIDVNTIKAHLSKILADVRGAEMFGSEAVVKCAEDGIRELLRILEARPSRGKDAN
jgi:hypothetical protein